MNEQTTIRKLLGNIETRFRNVGAMFPGYGFSSTDKRDHYVDFGWKQTLQFADYYNMYTRNGIAKAAVSKTTTKTWQDTPMLQEDDNPRNVTSLEAKVEETFRRTRFWNKLLLADKMSLVGKFSAIVFRISDGRDMSEPTESIVGLEGLVEIIPVWESQLTVDKWDEDINSLTYGQPLMYSYNEINPSTGDQGRQVKIHPDRVFVWSVDGTMNNEPFLSAAYNDLVTLEKIVGAGGEGFWKNAKSAPILNMKSDARIEDIAKMMGLDNVDQMTEAMNEQVREYQRGIDAMLLLQNIEAKSLDVKLPQPAEFVTATLQSIAASVDVPLKVLVGTQTGERASSEDSKEWAQTIMHRRNLETMPNISLVVDKMVRMGILADKSWSIRWTDLTESTVSERVERVHKMSEINERHYKSGNVDPVFAATELREAAGYGDLNEQELEDPAEGDEE